MESKYHEGAWSLVFVTMLWHEKRSSWLNMLQHVSTCFSEVSDLFSEAMDISVSEVETTLILEKRCKEEEASAALDVALFWRPRVTS
jgi:hypothetical protein